MRTADVSLSELARVATAAHRIEECFRRAKGEAGLADYQVRNWIAWHHQSQFHYRKQGDQSTEEQATAEAIIVEIGSGLGSLRDMTRNTLTIISCVESTLQILRSTVLKTFIDRFESPRRLSEVGNEVIAQAIVSGRLVRKSVIEHTRG